MKKKIPKIILILSFAPYVFCLLYGICSAIFGFGFIFNTSYGFDAFMISIVLMGLLLCYYPVIPICLIYQLVYLAVFIMKKRNISLSKKSIWLISGIIAVILVFVAVLIYCNI
ncbi:MAG: hypothetical protein K2N27_03065 [Ruminococcus sp.]|nr:hypothetical protein [Ruminococcus sp.]